MENADRPELTRWVEERLSLVAPPEDWNPNPAAAHARFKARLPAHRAPRRYWLAGAATASLAMAALLAVPSVRVFAQQVWQRLTAGRIEVVRVDFDSLPDEAKSLSAHLIQKPAPPQSAASAEEAARLAGFPPRLPAPGILAGSPRLSVLGPMSFGTTIQAADLELALRKAGVSDQPVPRQWDGAQIALAIGFTVTATWSDDTWFMQGLPPVISMPTGFDLGGFLGAVLRAAGMRSADARQLGRRIAASPAMLLGIGGEEQVNIRDVKLRSGPGTVMEDFDEHGRRERVAVVWSAPDRIYLLSGGFDVEKAIAVANAVE